MPESLVWNEEQILDFYDRTDSRKILDIKEIVYD